MKKKVVYMGKGCILFLLLAFVIYISIGTVFAQEDSEEVISMLRQGEEFQKSIFKTGRGVLSIEQWAQSKENSDLVRLDEECVVLSSVFNEAKVKMESSILPTFAGKIPEHLSSNVVQIISDWNTIEFHYPGNKMLEIKSIQEPEKKRFKESLPHCYGTFWDHISPLYKLTVTEQKTMNDSFYYIIEGIFETIAEGIKHKYRIEAVLVPQRGYFAPILKIYGKVGKQNEVLIYERETTLKEYSEGLWAPSESIETTYAVSNPADIENTRFIRSKKAMEVIEYSYNIPLTDEDLELEIPPGTTVIDLDADTKYVTPALPLEERKEEKGDGSILNDIDSDSLTNLEE